MPSNSLKESNKRSIWLLIVIDIVIFLMIINDKPLSYLIDSFSSDKSIILPLVSSVIGPLVAGILNGFIRSRMKDKIVFWRKVNVLPGHRAFSEIVHEDDRVNVKKLEQKLGGFPENGKEQNTLWYELYVKHREITSVKNSHQSFLLYRDFTAISFLLSLIALAITITLLISQSFDISMVKLITILGVCMTQYFIFLILARNMGNRFVENVLAEESVQD